MTTHGGGPQQQCAPHRVTESIETPLDVWVVAADGSFEGSAPPPAIAAAVAPIVQRACRSRTQQVADTDLLESNNSHPIRVTARPIAGGAVVVAVLGLDAVREAEESLLRYDLIMRATHDAVWDWNTVTREAWWNPLQFEVLGYDPLTTVPSYEAWLRRIHPEDRDRVVRSLWAAVERGASVWQDEFRFLRGEGDASVGVTLDRCYIQRDADGNPLRMIGVMTDVTELRATTAALQASEERFRQLTSAIEEVFWLVSWDKREALYVSPGYEKIWGRPLESVYREPDSFLDAIHEDDRARVQAAIGLSPERGYAEVYRIRRPDGKIAWIRDRGFPIRDAAGEVIRIAGVATDITAQRELEEQLAHAQRMESIGRLAGGIAHDFNNLLTVILASVQLAARGRLEATARTDLDAITDAAQRAAKLTGQLLAFASRQRVAPALLDLNELTRQTESLLRRLIGAHIELTIVLDPGLHAVVADRAQLEQVLFNLAINARDAMSSGGRLTIETRNLEVARELAAAHPHLEPGEYVMLSVSDTGVGIPREVLPHIFEPFFTTKAPGQGTGLGLATSYGVVRQAGGELLVHTESGLGTTFEVVLPRVVADFVTTDGSGSGSNLTRATETVLFVEDDSAVRRIGLRIMTDQGYHMLSASSGTEALRLASEHSGPIHLLLTDVVMPDLSGLELARLLVEKRPEMRVLYTSGYAAGALAQEAACVSQAAFLQKPYVHDTLLLKVREVLDAAGGGESKY
jgi:two-component system cell cycle sensor histidine kinase/response regulator CckA